MLPPLDQLNATIGRALPGASLTVEGAALWVQPHDLVRVCRWLNESPDYQLDYLSNLTVVDYPPDLPASPGGASQTSAAPAYPATPARAEGSEAGGGVAADRQAGRMEMVYHLYSMVKKHGPVTLKATLPRGNPVIPSLTSIYRGAEFQEREVYDLFGVTFAGHPDLRRILMWDSFTGHPMRKDYVPENQDVLEDAKP